MQPRVERDHSATSSKSPLKMTPPSWLYHSATIAKTLPLWLLLVYCQLTSGQQHTAHQSRVLNDTYLHQHPQASPNSTASGYQSSSASTAASHTDSSACPSGLLTFELSTGFIYKPSSAETLDMKPSTLQLTDCLDYCLHNASCLAINFEMGLCVLLSTSAKQNPYNLYSSQFPVFTIYAEKKCLLSGEYSARTGATHCAAGATMEVKRRETGRHLALFSAPQCVMLHAVISCTCHVICESVRLCLRGCQFAATIGTNRTQAWRQTRIRLHRIADCPALIVGVRSSQLEARCPMFDGSPMWAAQQTGGADSASFCHRFELRLPIVAPTRMGMDGTRTQKSVTAGARVAQAALHCG